MKKLEIFNRFLVNQKKPSASELTERNRSLSSKNNLAYAGLIGLTVFSGLMGFYSYRTTSRLKQANQENETLRRNILLYQEDSTKLSGQNASLRAYASDAYTLANSMQFYPEMPDSITSLPENEQEKASKKFEKENQKAQDEHDQALKKLGVDKELLSRIQKGYNL